uniref:Peptidase M12B domain-containing protein n=1 Tax=Ditylenchus dipsaci TaxID=166011 RepID=A0A915EMN6_9BILA
MPTTSTWEASIGWIKISTVTALPYDPRSGGGHGVQKVEHVPKYDLVDAQRERLPDGTVRTIRFKAWNSTYVVQLQRNDKIISPHMTSVVRDGNSSTISKGFPSHINTDCHFHGQVISHNNEKAAISDCSKLMGVIVNDDHFLMLQTIPHRFLRENEQTPKHLVYKREAALINPLEHFLEAEKQVSSPSIDPSSVFLSSAKGSDEDEEFCDISKSMDGDLHFEYDSKAFAPAATRLESVFALNYTLPSEAKLDSLFIFPQLDPITLEIGLFLDSQLYEHFKREFTVDPEQHLTDFSLALINNVHVLYQQPTLSPNLDIVIVHFEMWKTQPARINPGSDLTDPNHWDHGVLLTGYDIYHTTASVAGVAPVGRMCDDLFACSLVEASIWADLLSWLMRWVTSYMGMVHDGVQNQCGRSCCLMSAVNGAGKTTWSTCSVREFNSFLLQLDESGRGNCLRDPAESIASHDHLKDGRLPGQRFTADQQCSYFWGRDYQVEIPNGRIFEDICRILWCGNNGSTISTAHPALEGSWCGGTKWCHEGKCEQWNMLSPAPTVVNGEWSEWSSVDKQQCPITPCQITGSIALKSQLRTCTNPAPNNGGANCFGSNVRGLLCGQAKSTCEGFTRQEFGDRLCAAIRNDPSRPDRQLSGQSFAHTSQPCKIWCHVRDSELIRNKGQFPNGSPCGVEQYCVSGTCLSLSCNKQAVVSQTLDCPPLMPTNVRNKQSKWDSWAAWSQCSVTCGDHGVQKRLRKCRSPDSECAGKSSEVRPCEPIPPRCQLYSEWTIWTECSETCGPPAKRKRTRTCLSDTCDFKLLKELEDCKEVRCPEWETWQDWSICSAHCGQGERQRTRKCSVEGACQGESQQLASCFEKVPLFLDVGFKIREDDRRAGNSKKDINRNLIGA